MTPSLSLQPYMLERHPAYRAQIALLDGLGPGVQVRPTRPDDTVEHERWASGGLRASRALFYASARASQYLPAPDGARCHYFVGDFPPRMHFLLRRHRVHVDADDPLNLYRRGGRNTIDGAHCRRVALGLLGAMRRGTLTLSFWSRIQLFTFAVNLETPESRRLVEEGVLRVMPPSIPAWPVQVRIGEQPALRCLTIATGKFWHKGVADAVTAVHRAARDGHRITLTVIGEAIPDRWRRFMAADPSFTVMERLSRAELDRVFTDHDLMVLPSHHDTYGWVIVEGKARGLPAVATDFYSRPEIIDHEEDGLLVPDPFDNPFLPISPLPYAAGLLAPGGRDDIDVHPLLEPYVASLQAALVRCHTDRALLRAMGARAYRATAPDGRFGTATRLAALRDLLRPDA